MLKSTRLKKESVLIDSKLAAQQLLEVLVALQSNGMKLDEPRDFANELGLILGNMCEDNDEILYEITSGLEHGLDLSKTETFNKRMLKLLK